MTNIYEIFPVPQKLTNLGGEAKLTTEVNVVIPKDLKDATWHKLQEVLEEKGLVYSVSNEFVEGKTNIYLALTDDVNEALISKITSNELHKFTKFEGYSLVIDGTDLAQVALVGCDGEGLHYAVVTLHQILNQVEGMNVKTCMIEDYPNILYRGFIEGFYGFPWTHEDRMDLMAFGGEYKMNTYIYAPKDDPYHRKHWRDLYPVAEAAQIAELAATGHKHNLSFMWTIHPGDTIDLTSEEDLNSALAKFEQLYGLGVRQFGILFDDIGGIPNGKDQADFINSIDDRFIKAKGDIRPLITVGTRYCEAWGPSMIGYFKPFVETLHDDVEIMWTGAATMSNISREQCDAPKRTIESDKNLSIWWNYPVNDYCDAKMLMGKIENLSSDLDNVNGFFSNPMNQAQASKQALFCIADHNWNAKAFNPSASFSASFRALAPEVAHALEIFASNSCYLLDDGGVSGDFLFDESWYLKEDVKALQEGVANGSDLTAYSTRLLANFEEMEQAADTIMADCTNTRLVEELAPFVAAFKLAAKAGQNAIHAVEAYRVNDALKVEAYNEAALSDLHAMEDCKVLRFKDGREQYFVVDVATHVIKPFVKEIIGTVAIAVGIENAPLTLHYDKNNIALSSLGVTVTSTSDASDYEACENVITGQIAGRKWCSRDHHPQITLDLQEVKNIKQYRVVNCGHHEAKETQVWNTREFQILTSIDGENFTVVDEVVDNAANEVTHMLFDAADARYVRLQIIEPAQTSINGNGHTRIYAFELFDEAYPDQSRKVLPSEIEFTANGDVVIHNVNRGDVVALYNTLDAKEAVATSKEVVAGEDQVVFTGIQLEGNRIFVERTSKNYLPSVRTSKGLR